MPRKPTGRPNGRPKSPLDGRMWRALHVEARNCDITQPWPWRANATQVAKVAGVSRQAIQKRRQSCELYRTGLGRVLQQKLEKGLGPPVCDRPQTSWHEFEAKWNSWGDAERRGYITRWVSSRWKGPVQSQIDGQVYESAHAYIDHLIERRAMPWPHGLQP